MSIPKKEKPHLDVSGRELLAKNVARLRWQKSWSQELLAYEAGMHRTVVWHVENQKQNITIDNIEAIAAALQVEISDLFCRPSRVANTEPTLSA